MEKVNKKKIIWIDQKIDNQENTYTYEELTNNLPEYDIIKCKSVKETFDYITKNYEDFKFKLTYIIVSGTLSEDFFNEYVKKSLELHILFATIIYCSEEHRKMNEFKPFYLDNFLNPGKVTDSSYFVIDYIKSVQCQYYIDSNELNQNLIKEKEEKINQNEKNKNDLEFAAEFTYVKDLGTMAYPIIVSKYINCTLIENEELETFQEQCVKAFPKLKHLFKPSQEKNIFIPYHILAKYYLSVYTHESSFYINMNRELRERKFDDHRIYIYLMYNALNKGIFKSYCQTNLYRGGTLSNEEFKSLMEKFEIQKNSNSTTNKIFFFSRKFLSFSKKEEIANEFLQTAIFCNFTGVYVRFIVEGIEDKDFFVSNIDINAMGLSAFADEEEVLFLPLSCFEVVNIEDQDFYGNNIKVLRLRYLNKYKDIIKQNFEKISNEQDGHKLEKFIEEGVNSKYSKGICKYLGHDFNEQFYNEISQKTNVELNYQPHISFQYKNSNPLGKKFIINKKFMNQLQQMENPELLLRNAEKLVDNLNTQLSSYQFGKFHGKDCIACYDKNGDLLYFDDGLSCHIPSIDHNLELCGNHELCQKEFIPESELYEVDGLTVGRMTKLVSKLKMKDGTYNQEGIHRHQFKKNIDLKANKIKYKQSGAIEANMVGNALGHFLANYDEFKKADYNNKIKIIRDAAIPFASLVGRKIIGAIPIFKNTVLGSIFRNGFIVISIFELCRSVYDVFFSDVLTTGEKVGLVLKKGAAVAADIACAGLGQVVGMKLALALGVVAGPGAIIIGGLAGLAFGYIGAKITQKINEKDIKRELLFYSDSLYFKYVPKKYREYAIPTLKWRDPPLESKSFAIELIVNEDGKRPAWVIINIPAKPKEMEINEMSKEGETVVKYSGIPENAFSGCFFLYVFDIKEINYKQFVSMKNGLDSGEELRKHLIDYKMLVVS